MWVLKLYLIRTELWLKLSYLMMGPESANGWFPLEMFFKPPQRSTLRKCHLVWVSEQGLGFQTSCRCSCGKEPRSSLKGNRLEDFNRASTSHYRTRSVPFWVCFLSPGQRLQSQGLSPLLTLGKWFQLPGRSFT